MNSPLKSFVGFSFSVAAYTLLFFWPALLSLMIFADYGEFPGSRGPRGVNYLHYDLMVAAFHAEVVWMALLFGSLSGATLFSWHLCLEIRPANLGDWQPICLHLFFILGFGLVNWLTILLMSLMGWQHE